MIRDDLGGYLVFGVRIASDSALHDWLQLDILHTMSSPDSVRANRIQALAATLQKRDIGAFFCTSATSMNYLAGLHEEGGERLLFLAINNKEQVRLVCPSLAKTQAEKHGISDIADWADGVDPYQLVKTLASDWGLKSVAVDDEMRASILLAMQSTLPGVSFQAGQQVLGELMSVKSPSEIATLKRAGKAADDALAPVLAQMKPGMTEFEVNDLLFNQMKANGGNPTFCIIGTGQFGAEPHHYTSQTKVSQGDVVVMDFGCELDGYMSDITRTVCMGPATDEQNKVYDTVYRAHMAARNAIKPGVPAEDIDKAARKVIEDAGYGEFFVHRTGHGLGMRIHEDPYICAGNTTPLVEGNVFSIEPGIYLPGKFGVRIENIVAVTNDGHESMNAEPSPTLICVNP